SGGSVIVFGWAAASSGDPSSNVTITATRRACMLPRLHLDRFDHVAQVAGRIPQRLVALRLADAVERTHHEAVPAWPGRRPRCAPLAERISAEILTGLRAPPADATVVGDLDLADPVAAVEGDALERRRPADLHAGPAGRRGDEGAHGHA